jgi:hypothetical protein
MTRALPVLAVLGTVLACAVAGVLLLLTLAAGWMFFVAWSDFGNLRCGDVTSADWAGMNGNCADAAWLMWRAGPLALVCAMGAGLVTWRVRHA